MPVLLYNGLQFVALHSHFIDLESCKPLNHSQKVTTFLSFTSSNFKLFLLENSDLGETHELV